MNFIRDGGGVHGDTLPGEYRSGHPLLEMGFYT